MNIILLHEKIKSYHDQVGSDRFPTWQIDNAIDTASRSILKNRYDKETVRGIDDKFLGKNQQNRDEIGGMIKTVDITSGNVTDNVIDTSIIPDDFWILIDLMVKLTSIEDELYPKFLNYNMKRNIYEDPYSRPSTTYPYLVYVYKTNGGREIIHGSSKTVSSGKIWYLARPTKPSYGTEINTGNIGSYSIDGENIIITEDGTSIDSTTYNAGDEMTWSNAYTLNSGSFVFNYTNIDLPDLLHEEICRETAALLSGTISDFNKGNYQKQKKLEE